MTMPTVSHATFTIERDYPASPANVFAAFADPALKSRWFAGPPDWEDSGLRLDFRVGGREHTAGGPKGGPVHRYDAIYLDIVPEQRIVLAYDMNLDERRISASLSTIELVPQAGGTKLRFTEQIALFDGADNATVRAEGTRGLLDALGKSLKETPPAPRDKPVRVADPTRDDAPRAGETTIRQLLDAYHTRQRDVVEALLTDDFRFTSPCDDHSDRATCFERCWPNSTRIKEHVIENFVVRGNEAFVTYLCRLLSGEAFRNTEFMTFAGDRLRCVDVYFGASYRGGEFAAKKPEA